MRHKIPRSVLGFSRYLFYLVSAALLSLIVSLILLELYARNSNNDKSDLLGQLQLPSSFSLSTTTTTTTTPTPDVLFKPQHHDNAESRNNDGGQLISAVNPQDMPSEHEFKMRLMQERIARLSRKHQKRDWVGPGSGRTRAPLNYNVHAFYYAWYANARHDRVFRHWNHSYLANWKLAGGGSDFGDMFPTGQHAPPADIASNYYPSLGCYSSADPAIVATHMRQLRQVGVGVVALSWAPPGTPDAPANHTIKLLFDTALKFGLKVALHVESYEERNPVVLLRCLAEFWRKYRHHAALFRMRKSVGALPLPVVYVYDSYRIPAVAWKELLSSKGNLSVRNTNQDAVFIGLLADMQHRYDIKKSQFDGFYTYFASNGFTYGSSWKNWRSLTKFAKTNGLLFIPSVGPGYVDTQVRPWNTANTRHRRHGQYYDVAWRTAINSHVRFVSITSFNEWHEGTQIEPARAANQGHSASLTSNPAAKFTYLDYQPEAEDYYLNLTAWWVGQFGKSLTQHHYSD